MRSGSDADPGRNESRIDRRPLGDLPRLVARDVDDDASVGSGIPTEREYVELYCRYTGRSSVPHWNFYLAFVIFRYAGIAQGVYKRGLQGNASSDAATGMKDAVAFTSNTGWSIAQS